MTKVFKVNRPKVVCETIDGEVVIVNLDKGYYYSLLNTGATIWSGIEKQLPVQSLIEMMTSQYEAGHDEIISSISEFIEQLQKEELIVPDAAAVDQCQAEDLQVIEEMTEKAKFAPPLLEKFSDMEDLLLLDPIHEVEEEAGWPQAKSA
jgi:hypothetical protein